MKKTVLTGIKPTGMLHLGNLIGAIRPALKLAEDASARCFYFIADYHALTTVHDPKQMAELTSQVTAGWLSCGLDPNKNTIYRQSDVPETFELAWVLSCFAGKGLLNRAHAYKAVVQENEKDAKKDPDAGISMGLFNYPVLMAADILLFDTDEVPVGEDQVQHIEIARDIAQRFNHTYGEVLKVPKAVIQKAALVPGLDGRKMSKSYDNTLPLFEDSAKLRKMIMKIQTDSTPPEAPKDPAASTIFSLYELVATPEQVSALRTRYQSGIGWGEAKQALFEVLDAQLKGPREAYTKLVANPSELEKTLQKGAQEARKVASSVLGRVRKATGIGK